MTSPDLPGWSVQNRYIAPKYVPAPSSLPRLPPQIPAKSPEINRKASESMASVTGVTATPATINPGDTSDLAVAVDNSGATVNVTVTLNGSTASAQLNIGAEVLSYSVDPSQSGVQNVVFASVDDTSAGSLAVGADGASFVFTANPWPVPVTVIVTVTLNGSSVSVPVTIQGGPISFPVDQSAYGQGDYGHPPM